MTTRMKIYITAAVVAAFAILLGGGYAWSSHKIKKLETSVATANSDAFEKQQTANTKEIEAAEYKQKIDYLEAKLTELGRLARKQDEQLESYLLTAAILAAMPSVLEIHAQSPQPTPNSAKSSPNSGIRASDNACMAAAMELEKTRTLVASLEAENKALIERVVTEKAAIAILTELNETRHRASEALKNAIDAKNETIAAKDAVIASQDKLIEALKQKRPSPWRRIGDILIGAAAIAVLK